MFLYLLNTAALFIFFFEGGVFIFYFFLNFILFLNFT